MLRTTHMKGSIVVGMVILAAIMGLIGCELFDRDEVADVTAPVGGSDLANFIMGDPAIAEWGVQYAEGNTYAMVNIPVFGALKVEYGIVDGGVFAIFLETTQPVELEIGLERHEVPENADSVVDVLEWVCVTYEEGAVFTSTPENVQPAVDRDGAWTHYQRVDADGGVHPWWLPDAAFVFGGPTQRQCVIGNRTELVTEVPGPFPKPEPTATPAAAGCTRVTTCTPGAVLVSCVGNGCFDGADNTAACRATDPYTGLWGGGAGVGVVLVDWFSAGGPVEKLVIEAWDGTTWYFLWNSEDAGGPAAVVYVPGILEGIRIRCE